MISSIRLQKILKLLKENNGVVTGEFLCNNLGVSSRTIRSDIKDLNNIIEKNGAIIISERARGYKLEIVDNDLFNNLINTNKEKNNVNNNTTLGRVENIIVKLLISKFDNVEGITQVELADELFVSISSLKNDMKIVKDILKKYNIQVEKVSNRGIGIVGGEENLRSCIKKYMCCNKEIKQKVILELSNIIKYEDEKKINHIVKDNISKFNFKLSDNAFNDIISLIIIMIIRDNRKNNIKYNNRIKEELAIAYRYEVAKAIFEDIKINLNINLMPKKYFT